MGCVSSTLLNQDEDFPQIGSTKLGHHIVSLTSTTYGLLTLDPPPPMTPPTPLPRFTLSPTKADPSSPTEVINSWELMAGLDSKPSKLKENSNPNTRIRKPLELVEDDSYKLEQFERACPRNGENRVVIYTTTLRGVRKTFEDCNAVRSVIQGLGFVFTERDISMDRGFRDELKVIMQSVLIKNDDKVTPPCLFIKGWYIGGADQVLKIHEEGGLVQLLTGLPRGGAVCYGCGDFRFMPCSRCNGSCKLLVYNDNDQSSNSCNKHGYNCSTTCVSVVIRCPHCNENGLVLCPICS